MNETHLAASIRYVELNPVSANLVSRASEWKESSANAHISVKDDSLVTVWPMLSMHPSGYYLKWLQTGRPGMQKDTLTYKGVRLGIRSSLKPLRL